MEKMGCQKDPFKMESENKTAKKQKKEEKRKPKLVRFNYKSVRKFLFLITVLLAILLMLESVQIFLQFKGSTKTVDIQRPVYIVESQPIDLDIYLREYFAYKTPKKTTYVTVTAYSSAADETGDSPHLTAIGTPVRDGIVAANFLPIGTVVRFPDKFGEKIFVVEDRMNERFGFQADIWMPTKEEAKKFGIQYLKMEIF